MEYKSYIADLHLNLHPEQIDSLEEWYEHVRKVADFFTIAYYPYHMVPYPNGFNQEEEIDPELMEKQWQYISDFLAEKSRQDHFITFLGYEWQGAGLDGDHNIYFKDDYGQISLASRYQELVEGYKHQDVIGIPHHLAYSLGNRGKNWKTHNEVFSSFAEIYSHHGSSECDMTSIPMDRHIHMGPRVDGTTVVTGLKSGYHFGIIASGDNHDVPALVKNGRAGVWAKEYSKDAIWEAFLQRRTFGFTDSKILVWTELAGHPMGSIIETDKDKLILTTEITANSKIERVELYKDGDLSEIKLGKPQIIPNKADKPTRFKFRIECGWGPNVKFFPDITKKIWKGSLETSGEIVSVEPIYSSFENDYTIIDKQHVDFTAISQKSSGDSHWMRDTSMKTEGFIFEIKAPLSSTVVLEIDGKRAEILVADILKGSSLLVYEDEAKQLLKETTGIDTFTRSDSWYHNAYKVKIYQGFCKEYYQVSENFEIDNHTKESSYFVKAIQSDGQTAWSSPIWVSKR